VKTVFLVNNKLAVLDLNEQFAEGHRSGIMVEDFTILSLIDTLAANFPQLEQVKFLVDGKERETLAGHTDLKTIYNTAAVHKVVEQLQ
jgi:spore germination protein GerM